ncbi:hypothetical protein BaRGS_00016707 [Batillaria attramentaria]|uniref:Uncharacterized protein n=1 Tax=Batillaria attramentaria TaxID=370345 RepID=A0ABD0KY07_9CAEN
MDFSQDQTLSFEAVGPARSEGMLEISLERNSREKAQSLVSESAGHRSETALETAERRLASKALEKKRPSHV